MAGSSAAACVAAPHSQTAAGQGSKAPCSDQPTAPATLTPPPSPPPPPALVSSQLTRPLHCPRLAGPSTPFRFVEALAAHGRPEAALAVFRASARAGEAGLSLKQATSLLDVRLRWGWLTGPDGTLLAWHLCSATPPSTCYCTA